MTDWSALVPIDVARSQVLWERRATMLRMRDLGYTYRDIGMRFRVSQSRAAMLCEEARRRPTPPVQRWLNDPKWLPEFVASLDEASRSVDRRERYKRPFVVPNLERLRLAVQRAERDLEWARTALANAEAGQGIASPPLALAI